MKISTQLEYALNFTDSEREIAKYILTHRGDVLSMSTKSLAKATYTSPATIVRLFQKLGLEGYNDFKIKYSAELQNQNDSLEDVNTNIPFNQEDDLSVIAHKLATLHTETISDTLGMLSFDEIETIVKLMDEASTIDLYGSGNSLYAALAFQHKMTRIDKPVNLRITEGEQAFFAHSSKSDHLAIVISYSGETPSILQCAKIIKAHKTPLVAITALGESQLTRLADHNIHVDSQEKIYSKIAPFASMIAIEFVLDLLYSAFFTLNYSTNLQNKIAFDRSIEERHPYRSPISEKEL